MATITSSAALAPVAPVFSNTERLALAGFLAGYSGLTRHGPGSAGLASRAADMAEERSVAALQLRHAYKS